MAIPRSKPSLLARIRLRLWTMGYLYALLDAHAVGLRRAMFLYEWCSAVLGPGPPQRRCNSFKVPFSC